MKDVATPAIHRRLVGMALAVAFAFLPKEGIAGAMPSFVNEALCKATGSVVYSPPSVDRMVRILNVAQRHAVANGMRQTKSSPLTGVRRDTTLTASRYVPPDWFVRTLKDRYSVRVVMMPRARTRSIEFRDSVFFSAKWRTAFNRSLTHEDSFTTDGRASRRAFMSSVLPAKYQSDSLGQYVELPFSNNYAMRLALPAKNVSVCTVAKHALELRSRWDTDDYLINMPKMKFSSVWNLLPVARRYAPSLLTLDGLPETPRVTEFYQRASVTITETAADASAQTIVRALPAALPMFRRRVVFDRPFAFFIVDHEERAAFVGQVK